MVAPASTNPPATFHVSLNVSDMARTIRFYERLFDRPAAKQTATYAKFELDEPPLVLSLISGRPATGGNLNHVGIRLADANALVAMQRRLEAGGLATQREEGVQCCSSTQTKFWVTDPDRTLWEIYFLHEEDESDKVHPPEMAIKQNESDTSAKVIWRHQIPEPFPPQIPHNDNSVNEIVLEGTFNLKAAAENLPAMLAETFRALRPGGEVILHGLAGDKPCATRELNLPGPAAVVEYVPTEREPMQALITAGFANIRFEKFSAAPYFTVREVQMREILLVGSKPGHRPQPLDHEAVYLGPLAQVTDDFGNVFLRGERTALNIHDWLALSRSVAAGQFICLPKDGDQPPPSA